MITTKPALFTISKENLEKLKVLAQFLGKSKSKFLDDIISQEFDKLDEKKRIELMDKAIKRCKEEIQKLQS